MKHCDEFIEDKTQPECLRKYLEYNRRPAIKKMLKESDEPALFASLKEDREGSVYLGTWTGKNPDMQSVHMKAGSRVRVVMASRFGDVGITHNLKARNGYCARVPVSALTDFGSEAEQREKK